MIRPCGVYLHIDACHYFLKLCTLRTAYLALLTIFVASERAAAASKNTAAATRLVVGGVRLDSRAGQIAREASVACNCHCVVLRAVNGHI